MTITEGAVVTATQAPDDASRILESAWATEGVISLPIDPVKIAQSLGLEVFLSELPRNVSGALVKKADSDPTIILNAANPLVRRRFSCAHEIGHFILRSAQGIGGEFEYIDLRAELAAAGTDDEERYANAFAASLLMPEALVRDFREKGLNAPEIAIRFGVSLEATQLRLQNLGLVP